MNKKLLLKVRMIKNKSNGQVNISIPKKMLDNKSRDDMCKYKNVFIRLERFE